MKFFTELRRNKTTLKSNIEVKFAKSHGVSLTILCLVSGTEPRFTEIPFKLYIYEQPEASSLTLPTSQHFDASQACKVCY